MPGAELLANVGMAMLSFVDMQAGVDAKKCSGFPEGFRTPAGRRKCWEMFGFWRVGTERKAGSLLGKTRDWLITKNNGGYFRKLQFGNKWRLEKLELSPTAR